MLANIHVFECLHALLALLPLTGFYLDANLLELMLKVSHSVLGTRICPDNGLAQGLASLLIPRDSSLPLVRDSCWG